MAVRKRLVKKKRRRRRSRRKQRGGLYQVYSDLKAAADHAKNLPKNNMFRKVTVSRYGIPRYIQKRMYRYN